MLEFRHDGVLPGPFLFISHSFITSLMEYILSSVHSAQCIAEITINMLSANMAKVS
jgi:hypothetical protein